MNAENTTMRMTIENETLSTFIQFCKMHKGKISYKKIYKINGATVIDATGLKRVLQSANTLAID